jgi:signal peptidase I
MARGASGRPTGGGRPKARGGKGAQGGEGDKIEKVAKRGISAELKEWGKTIALTLIFLVVIRTFLIQTFVITSGSMEESLLVGDFLVVNRLALGTRLPGTLIRTPGYSDPRPGDVLVFDPAHEDEMKLVKRLIGMPGDTVEMRERRLYLNGLPKEEPYVEWKDGSGEGDTEDARMAWQLEHLLPGIDPATYRPTRDTWGPLIIPEGFYFMLGDNRDYSYDSRYWGLIERWRIEGRAMFFYFSYDRTSNAPFRFIREARWERIGDWIR